MPQVTLINRDIWEIVGLRKEDNPIRSHTASITDSVKWEYLGLPQVPKGKTGTNGFSGFLPALGQSREEVRERF